MVLTRDQWVSPRVQNQRCEDAAFARAERALRGIEQEKAAVRSHELQQLELAASFMRLEAAEEKRRDALTAAYQRKQSKQEERRRRKEDTQYHERTRTTPRDTGAAVPSEPPLELIEAAARGLKQRQRLDLDEQMQAQRAARAAATRRQQDEVAALVAADVAALRAERDGRDGRTAERKADVTTEWDRQQALARHQKGTTREEGWRAVPRQRPAGEWAAVV